MRFDHSLVVGGTGMLRDASIEVARRSALTTSVARTRASLAALDAALPPDAGAHAMLPLDWSVPERFLSAIEAHVAATRAPDLVVAWIHDGGLALRLAARLGARGTRCRFFHVIGSARDDPTMAAETLAARIRPGEHLQYHQVILGAAGGGARTRWLTHREISRGVVDALDLGRSRYVVGALDRWRR